MIYILRLLETQNALQLPVYFFLFFCRSCPGSRNCRSGYLILKILEYDKSRRWSCQVWWYKWCTHTGTNDLANDVNTLKYVRKLVKVTREITVSFIWIKRGQWFYYFWTSFNEQKNVDITTHFLRDDNDISQILNTLRNENPSNINVCYLNINSVRNKFSDLQEVISWNVDIDSIADTKIEASFPSAQFVLDWYQLPNHMDVTERKGGILAYVKSSISSRRLVEIYVILFKLFLLK